MSPTDAHDPAADGDAADDAPGGADPGATPRSLFRRAWRIGGTAARMGATSFGASVRGLLGAGEEVRQKARTLNAERLAGAVADLRGVAMKLGQFVSIQEDAVPEEMRDALSKFQSQAPPMVFPFVRDIVETELGGKIDDRFASFERTPLAAASLGQVHAATLPDGTDVCVKVQYPGIDETVKSDLRGLRLLAKPLRVAGGRFDLREAIDEIEDRLTEELDYRKEAENVARCAEHLADLEGVVVPGVHASHSTQFVITLDRLRGVHLDDFVGREPDQAARDEAGERLGRIFWHSKIVKGFLHADPHPGNYMFCDDGRVGLIDFGCVKYFPDAFRRHYRRLARGLVRRDRDEVAGACVELGILKPGEEQSDKANAYIEWGYLTTEPLAADSPWDGDWGEFMQRLHGRGRQLAVKIGVWLPRDLVYLHRVTFGMMCFWKRLDARINWHRLALEYLEGDD